MFSVASKEVVPKPRRGSHTAEPSGRRALRSNE
jgi:hypothetical protein